ncbi:MAG: hypothetical protein JNG82_00290 [Opitutaceae bacterium]|nr:hypothetical protein [Opitutaceae bacterium]
MSTNLPAILRSPAAALPSRTRGWLVAGLIAYVLLGTAVMDRWQHRGGQSIRDLGFGYGVLISALEDSGEYRVPPGVHYPGVAFSAHRLPFIPYFLIALKDVAGDDLRWVALAKCVLFGGLLVAAVALVLRTARAPLWAVLLLLGVGLTMPRWALNVFEVGLEEGYNITALTLLFVLLWFDDSVGRVRVAWLLTVGSLLVLLLFLKSSMIYWCLAVPLLVGLRRRDWRAAVALWLMVGVGLYGLAAFNSRHAGRFTTGSSWEGWNLYKGNCVDTATTYPRYSLDILDYEGKVVADRPLADEWDHNAYFKGRAVAFIRAHPGEFFANAVRKAWVFYGEVRATGLAQRGESRYARPEYLLQIPWMIVFRMMLWAAILLALQALWRLRREHWRSEAFLVALTYLVFLALYSAFHVVGFAYERHVMPVVMPTALYLLWRWSDRASRSVTS